jgi:uncharacterized protein
MSERNGYEHGVPCWVDTWRDDADTAVGFYTDLFGWEAARGEYSLFRLRGRDVAGVGAGAAGPPAWTTYVWVEDADATATTAAAAGGSLIREPFDSLDGGRIALVADPAGAVFGVWQPGEHRGAEVVNEPGAWAMSQLHSPNPDAAAAFYGELFGWTTEDFGPFTMFRLPGYVGGEPSQPVSREVIAAMGPAGDAPAHWSANFWVQDADAAAAKAAELGGSVVDPPSDSPGFRNAVLADPSGVTFEISQLRI